MGFALTFLFQRRTCRASSYRSFVLPAIAPCSRASCPRASCPRASLSGGRGEPRDPGSQFAGSQRPSRALADSPRGGRDRRCTHGPHEEGKHAAPVSSLHRWLHRSSVFLFVLLSAAAGVLLLILPWTPEWTDNYLLLSLPCAARSGLQWFFSRPVQRIRLAGRLDRFLGSIPLPRTQLARPQLSTGTACGRKKRRFR